MDNSNNSQTAGQIAVANVSLSDVSETASATEPNKVPTIDPTNNADCVAVEKRLEEEFDSWSVWKYSEPFRTRLGASEIGEDCMRALWYRFRWVKAEHFSGRMLRLFNRGHLEEPRIIQTLRGIGFEVHDRNEDGKQHGFTSIAGHYGGSCDSVLFAPPRYMLDGKPILLSVKTSGTGSAFNKYDDAMQIANPRYWAQENAYGYGMGIGLALWTIVNKNDDSIRFRFVRLDPEYGKQLEQKAARVIFMQEAPDKISKSPAFKHCSTCNFKGICHADNELDRNCRSCFYSQPTNTPYAESGRGGWFCNRFADTIPENVIPEGCPDWKPINKQPA